MRKLLILFVVAALLFATAGCKAQLDKVKIANLLTGFVLDYASGNEIDIDAVHDIAGMLAISFVEAYADEIPAKYREETVAFAKVVIPMVIEEFDLGLGREKRGGEADIEEVMAEYVLAKFELFHENY